MNCFDLHSHSSASDGSLPPQQLVARAIEQGVDVLALTDHDGTEGVEQALLAANDTNLTLIVGVEISVTWQNQTVHIIGLNIDHRDANLQAGLGKIREFRRERAINIAKKLEKVGIMGAYEGASQYASDVMLGRVHFAQFLVAAGYADNMGDVFKRYMVKNKPGYVTGQWASLQQAVTWITASGGQAVIAHPARYKMTSSKLKRLIDDFKACGGTSMEVVSGRQHPEEIKTLAKLANQYALLASRGSDFHSPDNQWIELGRLPELPTSVTPIWQHW